MRRKTKIPAVLLALCWLLSGCGLQILPTVTQQPTAPAQTQTVREEIALTAAATSFRGNFSPFFAETADDRTVAELTQAYVTGLDRAGDPILSGISGETRAWNGTSYTYTSAGEIAVTEHEDGTIAYDLTIRDDLSFSDGVPVTIDDLIFTMYVLADPAYDGPWELSALPIEGMEDYRTGMRALAALLAEAGPDNTDFSLWSEAQQAAFWEAIYDGGAAFVREIVDYCVAGGFNREDDPVAAIAYNWGYELDADADEVSFFLAMGDAWDWDFAAMEAEGVQTPLSELIPPEVYGYSALEIAVEDSESRISGIQRTGDYSLRVVLTEPDATALYRLALPIAPLHHYGDPARYDYDGARFGFVKGDLSSVHAKDGDPLGAGPYVFADYEDGTVTLEANPEYYRGAPAVDVLHLKEIPEADRAAGLLDGTLDLAVVSRPQEVSAKIRSITTEYPGYGYVGISAGNVFVEGDDEASRALRKGLATVLAAYRAEAVSDYYGQSASVIDLPGFGDTGEEALAAALRYFEAAGYTVEDGRLTEAPEGARLDYRVYICAGGTGDHPLYAMLQSAAGDLESIGMMLTLVDVADSAALSAACAAGMADLWCAAWENGPEPEVTYLMDCYGIEDQELEQLAGQIRRTTDPDARSALRREAMERLLDWAVEVPVYRRSQFLLVSTERVDTATLPGDMTAWYGWKDEIEALNMREGTP